eukprot:TRINITY_DN12218_c0_g1_i2.p1 TRINITY_DN12218_c0_g1~~TRINITY_DN12218_c0_g1_i2.p1  ORF type:complete len:319 (-),score=57.39 TRINITY_DN12218_c0_g1_i2:113-1069(-)
MAPWHAVLPQLHLEEYFCVGRVPPSEILLTALRRQHALLLIQLDDPDPATRLAALEALCLLESTGRSDDKDLFESASETFISLLDDRAPRVREVAVQALKILPLEILEERLCQLQEIPAAEPNVRTAVDDALNRVAAERRKRWIQAMVAKLADPAPKSKVSVLEEMATLEPEEIDEACADRVLANLESADWSVRAAVIQVLGKLPIETLACHVEVLQSHHLDGGNLILQRIPKDLLPLIEQCGDKEWSVRQATAASMARLPVGKLKILRRVLLRLLDDSHPSVRQAAAVVCRALSTSEIGKYAKDFELKLRALSNGST